jgi:hypothetical protein
MRYIVHSAGGFGHSFICQLIFNILTNGKYPIELKTKIGSAHPAIYDRLFNDEVSVVSGIYPVVKSTEADVVQFAITITEDDISLVELNHFYKNVMYNSFRGTCELYWDTYDELVNLNILPQRDIKSFAELPESDSTFLIKRAINKCKLSNYSVPKTLDNGIIELKFKDIFNDMNTTISIIENAVGIKATQRAISRYKKYIEAQSNLRASRFPWLPK